MYRARRTKIGKIPRGELIMMFLQIVAMVFSLNVNAQTHEATVFDELRAVQSAIDGSTSVIEALAKKDFASITHQQMSNAIAELAADLRARHNDALADELLGNWNRTQFQIFSNMTMKDLGDHAPLFQWLEDFFTKMADQYGTIIYSLPYVSDIRTLNFAIPVVFVPKGNWQMVGQDNRIEYRKHFIPFANIVTYYAAFYGCQFAVVKLGVPQLKQLCGKAADQLKFVMGRYIAPQVSDWIFKGVNANLELANKQMTQITAQQLLNAIKTQE